MTKTTHSIAALLIFLLPTIASAQVVITEIMYDPSGVDSGHEWVEVYNAGTSSIPLSSWKLYENGSGHNIVAASGSKLLAPNTYAVIAASAAKFDADYPDFAGQLFHSAFSLDNAGATIELHDASGTVAESASYDSSFGGLGDGNSLQRGPDDTAPFSPHTPTPGSAMTADVIAPKVKTAANVSKPSKGSRKTTTYSTEGYPRSVSQDDTAMPVAQTAAAAVAVPTRSNDDSYWWLAVVLLAAIVAGTIYLSRRLKSSEWDIIEETPEDV